MTCSCCGCCCSLLSDCSRLGKGLPLPLLPPSIDIFGCGKWPLWLGVRDAGSKSRDRGRGTSLRRGMVALDRSRFGVLRIGRMTSPCCWPPADGLFRRGRPADFGGSEKAEPLLPSLLLPLSLSLLELAGGLGGSGDEAGEIGETMCSTMALSASAFSYSGVGSRRVAAGLLADWLRERSWPLTCGKLPNFPSSLSPLSFLLPFTAAVLDDPPPMFAFSAGYACGSPLACEGSCG